MVAIIWPEKSGNLENSKNKWAMAKNGSTRCFFGQKRMYLKTIVAESVVGRI